MRRKVSLFLALFLGVSVRCFAIDPKTIENFGYWQFQENSSNTFSGAGNYATYTVNGYLLSLEVQAVGANASFVVQYSTGYAISPSSNTWQVNATSATTVLSGQSRVFANIRGLVKNAQVIIQSLGAGGTAYIRAEKLVSDPK